MQFVNASPSEFLVTGREGKVTNHGVAASAFLWPGSTFVLISSTKQAAAFEMTQESNDGIPLRFKGIVIYHITRPELTARLFDFTSDNAGHQEIKTLLSNICL